MEELGKGRHGVPKVLARIRRGRGGESLPARGGSFALEEILLVKGKKRKTSSSMGRGIGT